MTQERLADKEAEAECLSRGSLTVISGCMLCSLLAHSWLTADAKHPAAGGSQGSWYVEPLASTPSAVCNCVDSDIRRL